MRRSWVTRRQIEALRRDAITVDATPAAVLAALEGELG